VLAGDALFENGTEEAKASAGDGFSVKAEGLPQ
jgi:hypothetical protein